MIFVAEATFGEFHPALLSFCLGVAGGLTQSPLSSTISTQNGVLYGWSSGLSPSYYIHIFISTFLVMLLVTTQPKWRGFKMDAQMVAIHVKAR